MTKLALKPNDDIAEKNAVYFADMLEKVRDHKDRESFMALFDHFAPRLKSYLLRQGASDAEAEEFAQETMMTVWQKAGLFDRAKAKPSTWIFTIARNKRYDALRRKKLPTIDLDDAFDVQSGDDASAGAMAQDLMDQGEELKQALATLPEEQKDLLMRSFFDEKTHSEIAADTGIPLGTVKSRIRLALEKLRANIKSEELSV